METHKFRDFDAFVDSVRNVDCTMMLQNPKKRLWTITHISLPEVHIQVGRLGSGNIVEGQSWRDGYLLYLPLSKSCQYSANGTVFRQPAFMILEPGCEFCLSTRDAHDWATIFFPASKVSGDNDPAPGPPDAKKPVCRVTRENPQLANRFWDHVRQLQATASQSTAFELSPAAIRAAASFMEIGSLVIGAGESGESKHGGRPKFPRERILRAAREYLEEHNDSSVSGVSEIAAAAGVSRRTLRTVFNERYGVGPVRFLQLMRLHQINRDLRAANCEVEKVTDVFVRNGE